jgi:hypothetical protein
MRNKAFKHGYDIKILILQSADITFFRALFFSIGGAAGYH